MSGPIKLAIVGGGPSAFYVASRLLQLLPHTHARANDLRVHIYDRLWAPHGLVRYGVAPDHPEVKNCTHKFDSAASDPRVRFFGNVHLSSTPTPYPPPPHTGHALPLALGDLFPYYTHLLLATGAALPRLHPALPRSPLCISALDLVHWYTLHPSAPARSPLPKDVQHITLIGHGNVSLDIARLLLTPPQSLAALDMPQHVLTALSASWETLKHVSIVGRRGPREARFTAKEVREMMRLEEARMLPIPEAILDDAEGSALYNGVPMTRQEGRIMKLLREGSIGKGTKEKTFSFDFWSNPSAYAPLSSEGSSEGAKLTLEDTQLDPSTGRAVAMPTGHTRNISTDLIVTSLGYRGDPGIFAVEQGGDDKTQWYDPAEGHVRNSGGRVLTPAGSPVKNVYASGWAAHGARGVLASTLLDAHAVSDRILADHFEGRTRTTGVRDAGVRGIEGMDDGEAVDLDVGGAVTEVEVMARGEDVAGGLDGVPEAVERGVRNGDVLQYERWRTIEEEERRRGEALRKERERMEWRDVRVFLS